METQTIEPIKLIVCILPRGASEKITVHCLEKKIAFHLLLLGRGTADSTILDYLGLGETEKDIFLLSVRKSEASKLLESLKEELQLEKPGHGIAFSIPLSSVAERHTLELLAGIPAQQEV